VSHGWRVEERVLCLTGLMGGWIGGYWAMDKFRHKTQKQSFRNMYHTAVAINILVLSGLYFTVGGNFALLSRYMTPQNLRLLRGNPIIKIISRFINKK